MSDEFSMSPFDSGMVIVLGASGFIGSAVVRRARDLGLQVRTVKAPRLSLDPHLADHAPKSENYEREIRSLSEKFVKGSTIINAAGTAEAAAEETRELFGANALLPWLIAQAAIAAEVRRLVHISSAAVKGRLQLNSEPTTAAFSPYSRSKAVGESWLRTITGAQITILRPTSVHGKGRKVTETLQRIARSPLSSVAGSGNQRTPQIQLETVARSVLILATHEGTVPAITLTPDEKIEGGAFLALLGGHQPIRIPTQLAKATVGAIRIVGRTQGKIAANSRRLELMWFGQRQTTSWLDQFPEARAPRSAWRELAAPRSP